MKALGFPSPIAPSHEKAPAPAQTVCRSRKVPRQVLHDARVGEGNSSSDARAGGVCGMQGSVVPGAALVPLALCLEEIAHSEGQSMVWVAS